jgi:hypothetical protein
LIENILLYGILSIFLATVVAAGWLWNILIVIVMIRNRLPVRWTHQVASALPWGLSLYFLGVGLGLAILWYRDFRDGRYPDDGSANEDWLKRLDKFV